jgi:hypothetical protein
MAQTREELEARLRSELPDRLVSCAISRLFCIADKHRQGKTLNLFDETCRDIATQKVDPKLVDAWSLS